MNLTEAPVGFPGRVVSSLELEEAEGMATTDTFSAAGDEGAPEGCPIPSKPWLCSLSSLSSLRSKPTWSNWSEKQESGHEKSAVSEEKKEDQFCEVPMPSMALVRGGEEGEGEEGHCCEYEEDGRSKES